MELRPEYPVVTPRLRLRTPTLDDIADMLLYRGREDVCRFLPFPPMDEQVLTARINGDLGRTAIEAEGQNLTLLAERITDGRVVGDVMLMFKSETHRGGEIGWVFSPEVAGQGYATEAAARVLGLGYEQLGLHRVIARVDARNTPSARLAVRLGMRLEARFRENEFWHGEWADECVYAMLESEWPTSPAGSGSRPSSQSSSAAAGNGRER